MRRLTAGEVALARGVFADALDLAPVRLLAGGFGAFAVTLGPWITVPRSALRPDYARASLVERAWLIHELTHAWQFQTAPLRTLASWAKTAATGGYGPGLPGYCYALPLQPFARYGLERQAAIVEHAYLLREGLGCPAIPAGARWADYASATPFVGLS